MKVNALDLSPNFAGTLMGITNGIGALTGIVAVSSLTLKLKGNCLKRNLSALSRGSFDTKQNID